MTATQPALFPVEARPLDAKPTPAETECPSCGAPVIAALVDRVMPAVAVDPVALTPLGELQALMAGRRTFDHWHEGLDARTAWTIARCPADPDHPVRPEHRCGADPPEHYPQSVQPAPDPDGPVPF